MGKIRKITGYAATALGIGLLLVIFAMSLPMGGWRALSVQTGSMTPAIRPGALVFVHRVPESALHIGDVITYANKTAPNQTLTHRIVELKTVGASRQIIVKGDANEVPDAPVAPSQVVGKVTKSVPYLGKLSDFAHKPLGLALFVYLPGLLIVIYELRLLVRRLADAEIDKQKTALQEENDRKPLSLPIDEVLAEETGPSMVATKPRRKVRSLDGLRVVTVLAIAGLFFVHTTKATLNSRVTLTGTTISSAPISQPPPLTSCGSSNTNVHVTNNSTQTATSGTATVNNTNTSGTATSGEASNTNSTNTNVTITSHC